MSTTEAEQLKSTNAQAVDEEYKKLERFQVDRRKIVFVDHQDPPQGGFGIVLRAELHKSAYLPAWLASRRYGPPQLVAVKQFKIPPHYNLPRVKRAFTRETVVWSSLGEHAGISKFLGFYADFERSEAWLLSPWEPNGNVSEFVKTHNLEVPEKMSLIYDTIDALTFLHQRDPPVCHGDIKAANVLVGTDYKARLCDFGFARLHQDSGFGRLETSTGMKGSVRWCSPEILNGAPREPTSDVYAWAWLVREIMTGKVPYEETTADFVIMRHIFEGLLPQIDGDFRLVQVWELMTRCWNVEPSQRPTARMCKATVTDFPRYTPTSRPTAPNASSKPRFDRFEPKLGSPVERPELPFNPPIVPLTIRSQYALDTPRSVPSITKTELPVAAPDDALYTRFQEEVHETTPRRDTQISTLSDKRVTSSHFQHITGPPTIVNSPTVSSGTRLDTAPDDSYAQDFSSGTRLDHLRCRLDGIVLDSLIPVNTSGASCDLFKGMHPVVGKLALKRPRRDCYDKSVIAGMEIEANIWTLLKHPHILQFMGICMIGSEEYLVAPFAENGSLPRFLEHHPAVDRNRLIVEIAEGLAYLHQCGVVHGDLKGNNILVSADRHILICDFGLAKHISSRTCTVMRGAGSLLWQSPELLMDSSRRTFQSDVYAFGITIYEVLAGGLPFSDTKGTAAFVLGVIKGERPATEPSTGPDGSSYSHLWGEAKRCWGGEPTQRPSILSVLQCLDSRRVEKLVRSQQLMLEELLSSPNSGGIVGSREGGPSNL